MAEKADGKQTKGGGSWSGVFAQTIVVSLVFFALLYVLSVTSNSVNPTGLKIDPTLAFIALVPFIIWLIVSGRIQSLTGPGGWGVVFRNFGKQPISPEALEVGNAPLEAESANVVAKASVDELSRIISEKNPTTLSFELGRKNYYDRSAISKYLAYPHFRYVLLNDASGTSRGLMKVHDFRTLHNTPDVDTAKEIESGRISRDNRIIPAIREGLSNKEALQIMDTEHTDTLNVVDAEGKHRGVVTRDGIISKLMSKIVTV